LIDCPERRCLAARAPSDAVLERLGSQLCERNRHLGFVSRQGTSVLCQHWSDCRELAPIRVVLTFVLDPAIKPRPEILFVIVIETFLKDTASAFSGTMPDG
jgi:hypothetical protein